MKRRNIRNRAARALLVSAVFAASPQLVRGTAAITFQSGSSFSVQHMPNMGTPTVFKTVDRFYPRVRVDADAVDLSIWVMQYFQHGQYAGR